jgi:hypothetical protein
MGSVDLSIKGLSGWRQHTDGSYTAPIPVLVISCSLGGRRFQCHRAPQDLPTATADRAPV